MIKKVFILCMVLLLLVPLLLISAQPFTVQTPATLTAFWRSFPLTATALMRIPGISATMTALVQDLQATSNASQGGVSDSRATLEGFYADNTATALKRESVGTLNAQNTLTAPLEFDFAATVTAVLSEPDILPDDVSPEVRALLEAVSETSAVRVDPSTGDIDVTLYLSEEDANRGAAEWMRERNVNGSDTPFDFRAPGLVLVTVESTINSSAPPLIVTYRIEASGYGSFTLIFEGATVDGRAVDTSLVSWRVTYASETGLVAAALRDFILSEVEYSISSVTINEDGMLIEIAIR